MRLNWRASAMAAGAAFVVSVLAGIVGGVPLGTLIVRALVGAAVFGAGAVATSLVIDRYLPDLKQSVAGSGEDAVEQPPGSQVDIVVDDDTGEDASFLLDDDLDRADSSAEPRTPASDAAFVAGMPADEVHVAGEQAAAGPATDNGRAAALEAGSGADADEEPAELEEADDETDWGTGDDEMESDEDSPAGAGPAGRLPDMEGLSGEFAESATEYDDVDEAEQSGEDPSIMARAIRTVLKRDE